MADRGHPKPLRRDIIRPAAGERTEQFAHAVDEGLDARAVPHERHVADHVAQQPAVGAVVGVQLVERVGKPSGRVPNRTPRFRLRDPSDAHPVFSAGADERRHVGEVVVDRVALYARPLSDRADRRPCRADRAMELERRLRDSLTHRVEVLAPTSHPVRPRSLGFLLLSHVQRKY